MGIKTPKVYVPPVGFAAGRTPVDETADAAATGLAPAATGLALGAAAWLGFAVAAGVGAAAGVAEHAATRLHAKILNKHNRWTFMNASPANPK